MLFFFHDVILTGFRVLLAKIKFLAQCPCPRCLIQKKNIGVIGTHANEQ